jgi:hypothetical protein
VSQFSEFCRHNPLNWFSTSVYFVVVYFVIDSVRKILDTPSHTCPEAVLTAGRSQTFAVFGLALSLVFQWTVQAS